MNLPATGSPFGTAVSLAGTRPFQSENGTPGWFVADLLGKDQFRANGSIFQVSGTDNREPVTKPDVFVFVIDDPGSGRNKPIN